MQKSRTNLAFAYFVIATLGILGVWLGSVINSGFSWRLIGLIMLVTAAVGLVVIRRRDLPPPEGEKQVGPVSSETRPMIVDCGCLMDGPGNYEEKYVGVDPTNGRYGDVDLQTCPGCGRRWLHYRAEYEAFTGSGRWIVGLLPDELPMPLTPQNAVPILNSLPWYIYGGGFYGPGKRGSGNAPADFP